MKFEIEETNEIISNTTGLILINNLINKTNLRNSIDDKSIVPSQSRDIKNSEIVMTYMGILAQGKTEFERADEYRNNIYFKNVLNIEKVPSSSMLRQRLNIMANPRYKEDVEDIVALDKRLVKIIDNTNVELLKTNKVELGKCNETYVPLDIDVTPMDNSDSKKEGVSYTYKHYEGYAPIMAYIGTEGYLIRTELREGKSNGQCSKTVPFLKDTIALAKQVTTEPILVRTDCGHDCSDNVLIFTENEVDFVMAKKNTVADKPEFYFNQGKENGRKQETREGKKRYLYSYEKPYICEKADGTTRTISVRIVVDAVQRTISSKGQVLLVPEYEAKRYVTSLRGATEEEIIELYHAHGTSEQFHSEIKSDMDIERLPSGKFATNELVLGLGSIVYNLLKIIGQMSIASGELEKIKVKRKRIKTVIKDMILIASKLVNHARKKIIKIYKEDPRFDIFRRIYYATI